MKILLIIFFLLVLSRYGLAQEFDFYQRINNPLSICTIDSSTSAPLRYSNGHGYPNVQDPIDSFFILASDTGSGVLTHFWITFPNTTDSAYLKLYIDDSLVIRTSIYDFFDRQYGVLRIPFVTPTPGAYLCDLQIPYMKKFKISVQGIANDIWYAVGWHPLLGMLVPSFKPLSMGAMYLSSLDSAEKKYNALETDPWDGYDGTTTNRKDYLSSHSNLDLFSLTGPNVVQRLQLKFDNYDLSLLDSVFLDIKWDNSPYLSVHVPIADFFCVTPDTTRVHSFPIRFNKDSGVISYFPMPFAVHAKISLMNLSSKNVNIFSQCRFQSMPIDKKKMAYFNASFSETNPTRFNVFHPVLNCLGIGRLVGLSLSIPHINSAASLEGDPFINIDNKAENLIHYTGTEDYIDGGFYFGFHQYSYPFSGHFQFLQKFYRFHFLDAIDFKQSINFLFQHGANNNVHEDYRTCAYYYKLWSSFWTSRDTIKAGEYWNIAGSGYKPNSIIVGKFDNIETIFSLTTNVSGMFDTSFIVPQLSIQGAHKLSINGEERSEPVYYLAAPSIRPISDTLPLTLRCNDSLLVTGTGFEPNEKVQVFLDSILISDSASITGSDYRFYSTVRMPNIADWKYHLRAVGDRQHEALARDLITITRIIPFEFEDLIPEAFVDTGYFYYKNLSAYWAGTWSHQAIALFESKGIKQRASFKFYTAVSDTFNMVLLYAHGPKYGKYSFALDGKPMGSFDGYTFDSWEDNILNSDSIGLGKVYLAKDIHTFVFTCMGKDSAAKEFRLGADLLLLTPTTKMALPKGVFTPDTTLSSIDSPGVMDSYIIAYPNPAGSEVTIGINPAKHIADGRVDISLSDILGRKLRSQFDIPISLNGASTRFDIHSLPSANYVAEFIIRSGSKVQRISRIVVVNH